MANAQTTGPGAGQNPQPAGTVPAVPAGQGNAPLAPGAVPGAIPAQPGTVPGGVAPGGQPASQFKAGSAEDALLKFCTAMAEGNLSNAAEYISPKAKGILAQIRDGSITDEKITDLKESFSLQGLQMKPSRNVGGVGRTINLGNGKFETLSFTLVKEEDGYLLREFRITASKK